MVKKAAKYVLMGFGAIVFVVGLAQYQNCAPAGQSSSFNLGTSSTNGMTINGISMSASTYTPGAALSATAPITNTSAATDTITCTWTVSGTGAAQTYGTTTATNQICSLTTAFAPSTAGNYILTLTAVDTVSNQSTSNSVSFTSGSACIPNGQFCGSAYNSNYSCGGSPPAAPTSCSGTACCSGAGGTFNSISQSGNYCTYNFSCNY